MSLQQRLLDGDICLGMSLRQARTADIARILADCGYAWMFLDLEHGSLSFDTIGQLALAGIQAGVTPLVRVPDHGPAAINRVLSNGAMGVIVPHVDTPAQAAAVAAQCRFPPLGLRSVPGALAQLGYMPRSFADAAAILNPATMCVVMLESAEAIDNADAIAAVPGVDCLFVGASDLSFALGVASEYGHPAMRAAVARVTQAAARHGKCAGIGGVGDPGLVRDYVALGCRLVLAGNDLGMLLDGLRRRAAALVDRANGS